MLADTDLWIAVNPLQLSWMMGLESAGMTLYTRMYREEG